MKNEYIYKIRLVGADLYYQPTKGYTQEKTNFGKHGKIYSSKPTLKHVSEIFHVTENIIKKYNLEERVKKISRKYRTEYYLDIDKEKDLEIVRFKIIEDKETC